MSRAAVAAGAMGMGMGLGGAHNHAYGGGGGGGVFADVHSSRTSLHSAGTASRPRSTSYGSGAGLGIPSPMTRPATRATASGHTASGPRPTSGRRASLTGALASTSLSVSAAWWGGCVATGHALTPLSLPREWCMGQFVKEEGSSVTLESNLMRVNVACFPGDRTSVLANPKGVCVVGGGGNW